VISATATVCFTNSPEILSHFDELTDPRMDRTKLHPLTDLVAIALCATICGAAGWADVERFGRMKADWFAKFLELPHGIPSHDTFGRVFARLDTDEFLECLQRWVRELHRSLKDQGINIDGKTLRRSFDTATGQAALHTVSAWAGDLRLCLAQVAVDDKSNEITAVPKLLELLELTGAVVTLDAMPCQTETARAIRAKGADYVLTVKGNQPKLRDAIQQFFVDAGEQDYRVPGLRRYTKTERGHGRIERREYYVAPAPAALRETGAWADLATIGMVYRHRELRTKETEEVVFFISSLPPQVKKLAKHLRGHWGIENSLHWILDVTFTEDASRIRTGNAPEIAAIFRRLALSILQQDTSIKSSIRGKRLQAGWNNNVLEAILTGNAGD
jgi:predicted transposase YbfD/YdcC